MKLLQWAKHITDINPFLSENAGTRDGTVQVFWARTAHSQQNPAHKQPVDRGHLFFSIRPAHGLLKNYKVYLQISSKKQSHCYSEHVLPSLAARWNLTARNIVSDPLLQPCPAQNRTIVVGTAQTISVLPKIQSLKSNEATKNYCISITKSCDRASCITVSVVCGKWERVRRLSLKCADLPTYRLRHQHCRTKVFLQLVQSLHL